jgi:hypothetical protein
VEVGLDEGRGAGMLVLITPLGVQIHAEDRERPSGECGQGAQFLGNLYCVLQQKGRIVADYNDKLPDLLTACPSLGAIR